LRKPDGTWFSLFLVGKALESLSEDVVSNRHSIADPFKQAQRGLISMSEAKLKVKKYFNCYYRIGSIGPG
jgi:hypothetical protein